MVKFLILMLMSGIASSADNFTPQQVVPAFKPIVTPKTVDVADAGEWVRDDELVLGVVVEGEARAYPINMLTSATREIINDKLGGRFIAATW